MLLKRIYNFFGGIENINRFERIWKLAQVDFKKRYYNDRFGLLWAFLNPSIRVLVFYFVFTFVIARVREGIDNFALFLFSALIFWMVFVELMKKCMKVLVAKKYLTQNIKINVIDLFISTALSSFFGLVFNLSAYVLISLLFGIDYSFINLLYLPVLILIVFLIALGLGMILSISIIFFNDINHIVDIIILLGFWTSGVIFPSENILKLFSPLYYLNPFLGIFQNLRAILVYNTSVDHTILSINLLTGIIIYIIGLNFLNKNYQLANEKF